MNHSFLSCTKSACETCADLLTQSAPRESVEDPKEKYRTVILKWKYLWMNSDTSNYAERAARIDANMIHSLARLLADAEGEVT